MNQSLKFIFKKILVSLGVAFLTIVSIGFLMFYFLIDDNLDNIKTQILEQVQQKIGHEIRVETLEASWKITSPRFTLDNVSIFSRNKSQALNIKKIQADISWLSLIKLSPIFDEIAIYQPALDIKKGKDGGFTVNGIKVNREKNSDLSNWLLNQDDIVVYNADVSWLDMEKSKEILRLKNFDLHYGSSKLFSYMNRRTFDISTKISRGTEHKIKLNGYIDTPTIAHIKSFNGQININFDELDLGEIKLWTKYFSEIKSGIGDAEIRIKEDYLRILRYVRFFLNYSKDKHDPKIIKTIKKNLSGVSVISSERLLDEFQKLLRSEGFLKLTKDQDCLEIINLIFPQFKNISIFNKLNNFAERNFSRVDFIFLLSLLVIDGTDNVDYFIYKFNLSKKDKKRLLFLNKFYSEKLNNKTFSEKNFNNIFYFNGKEALMDIIYFKIFKSSKENNKLIKLIEVFKEKKIPMMPLKANILLEKYQVTEGKELGKKLKAIEKVWVNNNFSISEKEIQKLVRN